MASDQKITKRYAFVNFSAILNARAIPSLTANQNGLGCLTRSFTKDSTKNSASEFHYDTNS